MYTILEPAFSIYVLSIVIVFTARNTKSEIARMAQSLSTEEIDNRSNFSEDLVLGLKGQERLVSNSTVNQPWDHPMLATVFSVFIDL